MTNNTFDNSGDGDQNVAQGDRAIGKQENHYYNRPLKLRTVVLGLVLLAAISGAAFSLFVPEHFTPRNKKASTQGGSAPATVAGHDATVTYNTGVTPETFARYAGELAVTDAALASFFKIMEEQQVPRSDLDAKLRDIAAHYKELLHNLETVQSTDPQVVKLKEEATQATEAGNYAKAEQLLEDIADRYSTAAAEAHADNARLQRVQLRYAKAADYWQKAAALLPEGEKKDRALYLHRAAFDLDRIARYSEALPLYEQNLALYREIGDRAGEDCTLNNISQIYHDRGDLDKALKYLEQSLAIQRKIGNRYGEGATLNNISQIYHDRGDIATALKYLEQSLAIRREIGDRAGEGTTLNNIGRIYDARGDYDKALKYLEQSLDIRREIGDRAGEAVTSWNIGMIYKDQGDLAEAEPYISRAVQLAEEIGHPSLEKYRAALEALRAARRGL